MHLRGVGLFVHRAYSELDFLVEKRHFKSKVVVGTPGCSPSLQNAQKTLSFSLTLFLSLSSCVSRAFRVCKGALSREKRVTFLKGKVRKSGSTNVPPLCVEDTLRALVKGRRRPAFSSTRPRLVQLSIELKRAFAFSPTPPLSRL